MRNALLAGLLLLFAVLLKPYLSMPQGPWTRFPSRKPLAIEPMQDFNGKSRAELLELRQKSVSRDPELFRMMGGEYDALDSSVVNQIDDRLPWVGARGHAFSDVGSFPRQFRDGASIESAPWLNPYLPIMLGSAHFQFGLAPGEQNLERSWLPREAVLEKRTLTVTYDFRGTAFQAAWAANRPPHLFLINANAGDIGLKFFKMTRGTNVTYFPVEGRDNGFNKVMPCDQFWKAHELGKGKRERANVNYIRGDSFVTLEVESFPAELEIQLFRDRTEEKPTLTEVLKLEG